MQKRYGYRLTMFFSVLILALMAIGALWPAKYLFHDPTAMTLGDRLLPIMSRGSSGQLYLLGTDFLGRDLLSRMIFSGKYSLLISIAAAALTTVTAVCSGLLAGYLGGTFDLVIMRVVDAFLSLPSILLAVALAAVVGRSLVSLVGILCFIAWAGYTRVIRSEVVVLRHLDYVLSARAIGATNFHILARAILPNTLSTITVMTTFSVARFILVESSISFLGMGIMPPASSWGTMVGEAREYIFEAPMVSVLPGLMIVLTVMAVNFLGDGLRDRWDPYTRTR